MSKQWTDINTFLRSKEGESLLDDSRNLGSRMIGGSKEAIGEYNRLIEVGRGMYDSERALGYFVDKISSNTIFGRPLIQEMNGGSSYKLTLRPKDPSINVSDDDCPTVVISRTTEGGLTTNLSMPSLNLPMFVSGNNGEVGLSSAFAIGMRNAANAVVKGLKYNKSKQRNPNNYNDLAKSIQRSINREMSAVTHYNPAISTKEQASEYNKMFKIENLEGLRREAIHAMSGQALLGFYGNTLFKRYGNRMGGNGAPRSERDFARQFEDIKNAAYAFSSTKELGNFIKQKYPWMYSNVWSGDLENLYESLYKLGVRQGTKKDGAIGVWSLFDMTTPGSNIAPIGSNKPSKNMRGYQKNIMTAKHASGANLVFTNEQRKLYGDALDSKKRISGTQLRPTYYAGTLSQKSIQAAATEMMKEDKYKNSAPFLVDALKGIASDGSLYAESIIEDFQNEVSSTREVSGETVQSELKRKAKKWIEKNKDSALKTIDAVLNDKGMEQQRNEWIDDIIRHELGLDIKAPKSNSKNYSILDTEGKKGSRGWEYDADTKSYLAKIKTVYKNPTFTARGMGLEDFRSVMSEMYDELLGRAFEKEGYSDERIYKDATDKSKGLRMVIGREQGKLESKNIWSTLNGIRQYILDALAEKYRSSSDEEGIRNSYKAAFGEIKGTILEKFMKWDDESGTITFDNDAYERVMRQSEANVRTDGSKNRKLGVTGMLEELIKTAVSLGVYDPGEYTRRNKDGSITLLKPLITSMEIGRMSGGGGIYQGDFSESGAGMKFSSKELYSLKGTLGRLKIWDAEKGGKNVEGLESLSRYIQGLEDQMESLKAPKRDKDGNIIAPGYGSYEKNIEEDLWNFRHNISGAREDLVKKGGLLLTPEDFEGYSTDIEYQGDLVSSKDKQKQLAVVHMQERRKQHYNELLSTKGKDWLESRGIYSEFDVPVGLSTGDRFYTLGDKKGKDGKPQVGGLGMFGVTNLTESNRLLDDNGNPTQGIYEGFNKIAQAANSTIKAILELDKSESNDLQASIYAGKVLESAQLDAKEEVTSGSIFEKMNRIKPDSSAYLLLQSMTADAKEIFGNNERLKGRLSGDNAPDIILNKNDMRKLLGGSENTIGHLQEVLNSIYGNNEGVEKVNKSIDRKFRKAREKLLGEFAKSMEEDLKGLTEEDRKKRLDEAVEGKLRKSIDKARKNALIQEIVDTTDIGNLKTFKGSAKTTGLVWRSPTLKMFDDIVGGRMVSSSRIHSGNMMMNPYLGNVIKADYDGDRVAIFNAVLNGEYGKAQDMLEEYFSDIYKTLQVSAGDKKEGVVAEGNVKEIDSILDKAAQKAKMAAQNTGAKGAGIYGNLLYGLSEGFKSNGLGFGSILTPGTGEGSYATAMATTLAGALYQNGINIKNLKATGGEGATLLNDVMFRISRKKTWDDYDSMKALIEVAQKGGILESGKKGVFKQEVMDKLLGSGIAGEREYYAKMASQLADRFKSEGNKEGARKLNREAEALKSGKFSNISAELLSYIITTKDRGGISSFLDSGTTVGDIATHLYDYIQGHSDLAYRITTWNQDNESYDDAAIEGLKKLGIDIGDSKKVMKDRSSYTITDWASDAISSWGARYADLKNRLREGKKIHSTPHGLNNLLLGPYNGDPRKSDYDDILAKIIDDAGTVPLDSASYGLADPKDRKEFVRYMSSTLRGSFIHSFTELMSASLLAGKEALTQEDLIKSIQGTEEYKKLEGQYTSFLRASGKTQREIDDQIYQDILGGGAQASAALGRTTFSFGEYSKLRSEKQRAEYARKSGIIGAEMPLIGLSGDVLTSGRFDFSNIKDGTLFIRDLKNLGSDKLSPESLLQTAQYLQFFRLWKENIKDVRASSADAYFHSGDTVADAILENIKSQSIQMVSRDIGKEKEDFGEEEWKKVAQLEKSNIATAYRAYDAITNADSFRGIISQLDGGNTLREYEFNIDNPFLKGFLARANYGGNQELTDTEKELLTSIAEARVPVNYSMEGVFRERFNELTKLNEQRFNQDTEIESLTKKTERARLFGNEELAKKLELQLEELKEKKKELNLNEKIDKAAREYNSLIMESLESDKDSIKEEAERYGYLPTTKEEIRKIKDSEGWGDETKYQAFKNQEELDEKYAKIRQLDLKEEERADFSKYFKESLLPRYEKTQKFMSGALGRKEEIDFRLRSPYLTNIQRDEYEAEKESLVKSMEEAEREFKKLGDEIDSISGVVSDAKKIARESFDKIDKESDKQLKQTREKREREKPRTDMEESLRVRKDIESAYGVVTDRSRSIWEHIQELGEKGLDPTARALLEQQVKDQRGLLELDKANLQDTLDKYKVDGKLPPEIQSILDKIVKQFSLEDNMKRNAWLAKNLKGTSSEPFSGILGMLGNQGSMYFNRLFSGGLVMRGMGKLRQGIQMIVQQAKELDKAMTNVRIVTNDTEGETRNLITSYAKLGKELGVATREVTQAGVEWMRQGYEVVETNKLIKASMYLSKLGMIDSTQATKNLTSAIKGFKLEASQAMDVVDKLTSIDLKAATSAGDIAEGLAQFANLGSLAGVDIDQAAAYVATIADVTQKTGSSAGQALKTIISRYGNVKAGAYNKLNVDSESSDISENLNDVERVLSKIGISIRSTNLEFKDFDEILEEVADRWNTLDNVSKRAIATAFAGVRQQEALLSLLENWDKYKDLVETSRTSRGTAEMKYDAYRDSLEASMNRLTATFEEFTNRAEINNLVKILVDLQTTMASWLDTLVKWGPTIFAAIENFRIYSGNSIVQRIGKSGAMEKFFGKVSDLWSLRKRMVESEDIDDLVFGMSRGNEKPKSKLKTQLKLGVQGIARTLMGGETEAEKQFKKKEENEKIKSLNIEKKITEQVESRLDLAKLETKYKEDVEMSGNIERLKKGETLNFAQLESFASKEQLSDEQLISMIKQGSVRYEDAISLLRKQGVTDESRIQKMRDVGATTSSVGKGGSGANLVFGVLSYAINQLMTGLSAWTTSGTTHSTDFKGMESVNSSETAHKASRAISTAFSLAVPFIGKFIGDKIGDVVAKEIDRGRDEASYRTQKANNNLNLLTGLEGNINTISSLASSSTKDDAAARDEAIANFLQTIYKSENSDMREMLEDNLRDIAEELDLGNSQSLSLNNLMEQYQKGDSKTKERIAKALEIAQKRVQMSQQRDARASEEYSYQQRVGEKKLIYNSSHGGDYSKNGIRKGDEARADLAGVGAGVATGTAVMGGVTALTAALATSGKLALGATAINPIAGAIVAGIGVLTSIGIGIWTGIATANAERAKAQEEERKRQQFNSLTLHGKIDYLTQEESQIREEIDNVDKNNVSELDRLGRKLDATIEYRKALQDQNEYLSQKNAEDNKLALEEALIRAKDKNGNYLMDMTLGQLETMDTEDLYRIMADAVGSNLRGISARDGSGQLTEEFISLATSVLKEDNEIAQFLSGENMTLKEAVEKLNPDDRFERERLENFARALNTDIGGLSELVSSFGSLKLSELLQGTTELAQTLSGYTDLMSSIADGQKSVSEWMGNIITQFPDLIQYMGDMPTLMSNIMDKALQLSERYLQVQWGEFASSKEFFNTKVKEDLLGSFSDETERGKMEALINKSGAYNMDSLISWLLGKGAKEEGADKLLEALKTVGGDTQVVSDIYKNLLSTYMDTRVKMMDKELDNLTKQRDMLQNINSQREYENKLIEARNKLEEAQNEKRRVYREGVGWVYEADQQKVAEAQEALEDVNREKDISSLTKQIETLTATRDEWSNIWEEKSFYLAQESAKEFEKQFMGEGNTTIAEQFAKITGDGGLLSGISKSLDTITSEIIKQRKEDLDKKLGGDKTAKEGTAASKSLTELWNDYRGAVGTERENDALKAFTDRFKDYSNAGGDTDAWFNSLDKGEQSSIKGTASEIGSGGYDKFKVNSGKVIDVSGEGFGGATAGLSYDGTGITTEEGDSIFNDMKSADKHGTPNARLWTVDSNGNIIDGGLLGKLGDGFRVDPSKDGNLYEYASRIYKDSNLKLGSKNVLIYGTKSNKWAYITDGGNSIQRASMAGVRALKANDVFNIDQGEYKGKYKVTKSLYVTDDGLIDGNGNLYSGFDNVGSLIEKGILVPAGETDKITTEDPISSGLGFAKGTLSKKGSGVSLVNELGTEAIVTPSGTVTALPSGTGVVPADITRNLWELGELAPGIMRALQMPILSGGIGNSALAPVYDDSLSVNNINMVVNADGSFDADRFVQSLRDRVALTRNNRK